ncbi:hypothetical protein T492DRAFT_848955 [Pavlovales sp. CCMP2436]|nr:hypothetical protein T492DRAFT_848955 [Pavlovales sp. CCMP2436]
MAASACRRVTTSSARRAGTHRDRACGGRINTFTELEYLRMMHEADPGTLMRKSPDRIDNVKGYDPGNVRVVSLRANQDRGDTPLEQWLPIAAERYQLLPNAARRYKQN